MEIKGTITAVLPPFSVNIGDVCYAIILVEMKTVDNLIEHFYYVNPVGQVSGFTSGFTKLAFSTGRRVILSCSSNESRHQFKDLGYNIHGIQWL